MLLRIRRDVLSRELLGEYDYLGRTSIHQPRVSATEKGAKQSRALNSLGNDRLHGRDRFQEATSAMIDTQRGDFRVAKLM